MRKARKPRPVKTEEFVLDGSVAVAWCFPDEKAAYPQAVLDSLSGASAVVPSLWHLEVGNSLLAGERRQRCTQADVASWLVFLNALPITVDDETATRAWSDALSVARAQNLSVYDAAYLELALRRGLALATLDEKLQVAAAAVGVAAYKP
jgi:predicted nucleic acid-binding protein